MKPVDEFFGCKVFNDTVMKQMLPEDVYQSLKRTVELGEKLSLKTADVIAEKMKEWAISLGATHFTHWFQPMTGITAEKHDSFIQPSKDGGIIMAFSGKNLIKGESDASSFPSGGLRATFEARGYTAWDPTSYAFVKDGTLYIPTCFCSFDGSSLDKKTPLLRSIEAIDKQAKRILKAFGLGDVKKVTVNVGCEQEYFLIDKKIAELRPDITLCGRTLLGYKPPKGQEMDDHYYGAINYRIAEYMRALDHSLWEHGVYAKTKHNEVAPAQHELAPVFTDANTATDQNQLTMDYMKSIAIRHDMVCLLHEKPFSAVNGSGKHNNWSLSTDTGVNLLDPGKNPRDNALFLLFLVAVISAVDEYQDILRASVASASNDHRLGSNEAPPAIISIFLGEELTHILDCFETGETFVQDVKQKMQFGIHTAPSFTRDSTDRNRTSPFAFTGNKFEFRMVGSSASVAGPNIVLNTAVAEILSRFADKLADADDFNTAVNTLIREGYANHKRIIFNGNNYSAEWEEEAKKRGLLNLKTAVDAIPSYVAPKNVETFIKHGVFNNAELLSRCDILLENYYTTVNIECLTLKNMLNNYVIPACFKFEKQLAELIAAKTQIDVDREEELKYLSFVTDGAKKLIASVKKMDELLVKVSPLPVYEKTKAYRDLILPAMDDARKTSDELEAVFPKDQWPFPSYTDILYSVK
ncbi:MAG: glutamine synthetase III [Clostridia bacterium]|nr:glutamine synthetase III [Clostridia bacterium]